MKLALKLTTVALAGAVLSACSSTATQTASSSTHPATSQSGAPTWTASQAASGSDITATQFCATLSAQQMGSMAHVAIHRIEIKPVGKTINCLYHFGNDPNVPLIEVSLTQHTDAHASINLDKKYYHQGTAVTGLGVDARAYSDRVDVALTDSVLLSVSLVAADKNLNHGNLKALGITIARAEAGLLHV